MVNPSSEIHISLPDSWDDFPASKSTFLRRHSDWFCWIQGPPLVGSSVARGAEHVSSSWFAGAVPHEWEEGT